jgi:hypothetical protein
MAGINTYDVCIVFNVKALDDDKALRKVTQTLAHDTSYDWGWIYTTLNERESRNGNNNDNQ